MTAFLLDRIANRRRTPLVIAGATLLIAVGGTVFGQTSNSMRIRSLGDSFAGIINDPQTDAFLNPARVGDLRDKQIYLARQPGSSLGFYFPDNNGVQTYYRLVFPEERVPGTPSGVWERSYTPYTIGLITPVTDTAKMSLTVDAVAHGDDYQENTNDVYVDYDQADDWIDTYDFARGWNDNLYHFVADAAVGTGNSESAGTRYGCRIRFSYDQMQYGDARIVQRMDADFPVAEEVTARIDYDIDRREYESTGAQLSIGLFRGTGFLAQVVFGGEGTREKLASDELIREVRDDDYDGNGLDGYGRPNPYYRRQDDRYNSDRSYERYALFGRIGLRWNDKVRSFHKVSWSESDGGGDGYTMRDFYAVNESNVTTRTTVLPYDLDGTSTGFATSHSVGVVERIHGDLLIALGLEARFEYNEFEEDGGGEGTWSATGDAATFSVESTYSQHAGYEREYWFLNFPVGLEWNFHRNLAWRFGVQARATRLETRGDISRFLGVLDEIYLDSDYSFLDGQRRVRYDSELYFNMGFGIMLWDKLSVDLLSAATTASFNAANVVSAQISYYF